MPSRLALCWIVAAALLTGSAAQAFPKGNLRNIDNALSALREKMDTPQAQEATVLQLLFDAGLSEWVAGPAPQALPPQPGRDTVPSGPAQLMYLDLRLPLARVDQSFGGKELGALTGAQSSSDMVALVIRGGRARLRDITDHLHLSDGAMIRTPLVVWSDAALDLTPGETLTMSRPDGAFLLNFGHVRINGATVRSAGTQNLRIPRFRPFVTTTASGVLEVDNATFRGLGFGNTRKFSGLTILKNDLMRAPRASYVRNSRFYDVDSLYVKAVTGVEVSGSVFRGARYAPVVIDGASHARVTGNLFGADVRNNAIRLLNGAVSGFISGNVVLGGEKSGIAVRSASHNATVTHNIVSGRQGGGITVADANCGRVDSNLVVANSKKGIEVRSSRDTLVRRNLVSGNRSAGIWISAQEEQVNTHLTGNVLRQNGSGLATATAEHVVLSGNDFSEQIPRLLGGDLAGQSRVIATDLRGDTPVTLSAWGQVLPDNQVRACGS
ncbi:MAG: right-handed parallel beta-helix repeat-containing protein [Pseudomonadota bacterium]